MIVFFNWRLSEKARPRAKNPFDIRSPARARGTATAHRPAPPRARAPQPVARTGADEGAGGGALRRLARARLRGPDEELFSEEAIAAAAAELPPS